MSSTHIVLYRLGRLFPSPVIHRDCCPPQESMTRTLRGRAPPLCQTSTKTPETLGWSMSTLSS